MSPSSADQPPSHDPRGGGRQVPPWGLARLLPEEPLTPDAPTLGR
jgi:hypothetical protein